MGMDIREVLNTLSSTKFIAQNAVQCDRKGQFYVDNGMNNVRAIINSRKTHVSFFCRYPHYTMVIDTILEEFAQEQGIQIKDRESCADIIAKF